MMAHRDKAEQEHGLFVSLTFDLTEFDTNTTYGDFVDGLESSLQGFDVKYDEYDKIVNEEKGSMVFTIRLLKTSISGAVIDDMKKVGTMTPGFQTVWIHSDKPENHPEIQTIL